MTNWSLDTVIEGYQLTADRAGLLLAADIAAALGMMLKDDTSATSRIDTPETIAGAVNARKDLRELIAFAMSDDFFRLRQRLGLSLG